MTTQTTTTTTIIRPGRASNGAEPQSFPNPTDITDSARPSSRQSRMTEEFTEYDDTPTHAQPQSQPDVPQPPPTPAMRVTAGESGSRPSSANTGRSYGNWSSSATPHHRAVHGSYAGSTGAASTRPPTSHSRTHVPSLTSQAFYRPMSSQRLQAQRGQRMSALGAPQPQSTQEGKEGEKRTEGKKGQRPMSRDSSTTEFASYNELPGVPSLPEEAQDPFNNSPIAESETPLEPGQRDSTARSPSPRQSNRPAPLNIPQAEERKRLSGPTSPRSFRSNIMSNRASTHIKLPSVASSARERQTQEKQAEKQAKKTNGKNYQHYPGNSIFFLGGFLLNTRSKPINISTFLFLIIPIPIFYVFTAPYLWLHLSPALPIVFGILFLHCFSSFLHASFIDPGFYARNLHKHPPTSPDADPWAPGPPTMKWVKVMTQGNEAMDVPIKYCQTCQIWREPRAHHCRECNQCIDAQDHHCIWLNNCVGRRNYKYFLFFITEAGLLGLMLMGFSLAQLLVFANKEELSFMDSIKTNPASLAMLIYGILGALYPLSLTAYHAMLILTGQTTREFLQSKRFAKKDRHRPFDLHSWPRNLWFVLCRRAAPGVYEFRKAFVPGDQRFVTEEEGEIEMKELGKGKART